MKIAVVTGASSGMGREFVIQLDKSQTFDEIWVIARRKDRLEALEAETRAHIRPIALDLSLQESYDAYAALLAEHQPEISVLVNGSGYGYFRPFTEDPLEGQLKMIDLNDKGLVAITYLSLPYMQRGGEIYQLGSLSSFQPVPYINLYGATKAFVLSFSRALNVELKPRGIRVMAVCPGWIKTEFFDTAITDNTITYFNKYYTSEEVVALALKDMKRGKDVSVLGLGNKLQRLAVKLLPHKMVMKTWCKQQKQPG